MIQYIQSKGWKRVYIWLFLTVPFLLFILEEATQTLGFGRFTLQQGQLWEEAYSATQTDKKINTLCLVVSSAAVPCNPLAGGVFVLYFVADRRKLEREVVRYQNELWGYSGEAPEVNPVFSAISKVGSRKLALLMIAVTMAIVVLCRTRHRTPTRKVVMVQWTEADLRKSASMIGIDEDEFINFCHSNHIPVKGKEKI